MIYLLRHGADDGTRLGGWSDASLSPLGIEQVQKACETIAEGNFNICRICSSDLPRAQETAEIIAKKLGLTVELRKDFREVNNGDLAGIKIFFYALFHMKKALVMRSTSLSCRKEKLKFPGQLF